MRKIFISLLIAFYCHVALASEKVAVIGAGLAGLTTAYRLHKAGYDVDVFEARERVGGRVFTVNLNGTLTELGGQNLDDAKDPIHIVALANELGLNIEEHASRSRPHFYDDKSDVTYDFYKEVMPNFSKLSEKKLQELAKIESSSQNIKEVLDRFLNPYPLARRLYGSWMRNYEGSEVDSLSPKYAHGSFLRMLKYNEKNFESVQNGENITFTRRTLAGGCAQLPEAILKILEDRVHRGWPLTAVDKSERGYRLKFDGKPNHNADIVVLAIPASVFHDIDFGPETIPSSTLNTIQSLTYGTISKILAPVDPNGSHFGTITTDMMGIWFSSDRKVATMYITGTKGIMRRAADFEAMYEHGAKAIATSFKSQIIAAESTIFRPMDVQFSSYKEAIGVSWATERYTQGGYSVYSPTSYALYKVGGLFLPINNAIYFAGEHTAQDNPATLEGAVESGERAAREIINAHAKDEL